MKHSPVVNSTGIVTTPRVSTAVSNSQHKAVKNLTASTTVANRERGNMKRTRRTRVKELTPAEKEKLIRARAADVNGDQFHDIWLLGSSIRELLNLHVIAFGSSEGVFKGVNEEEALAFLEKYPRFLAGGFIRLDEDPVLYFDEVDLTSPKGDKIKLGLQEIIEFANVFHGGDDFEVSEDSAFAWFD